MPSATYQLFREAILNEKQVVCVYNGCYREFCPHIIGYKDRQEKALAYQFGGESNSVLPPGGEWRCLSLSGVRDACLRDGAWHGASHSKMQQCVDIVDLDINVNVRSRAAD